MWGLCLLRARCCGWGCRSACAPHRKDGAGPASPPAAPTFACAWRRGSRQAGHPRTAPRSTTAVEGAASLCMAGGGDGRTWLLLQGLGRQALHGVCQRRCEAADEAAAGWAAEVVALHLRHLPAVAPAGTGVAGAASAAATTAVGADEQRGRAVPRTLLKHSGSSQVFGATSCCGYRAAELSYSPRTSAARCRLPPKAPVLRFRAVRLAAQGVAAGAAEGTLLRHLVQLLSRHGRCQLLHLLRVRGTLVDEPAWHPSSMGHLAGLLQAGESRGGRGSSCSSLCAATAQQRCGAQRG
jgi:hypothetical protein